jgi:polar amino acid transport system substrate-binding protein
MKANPSRRQMLLCAAALTAVVPAHASGQPLRLYSYHLKPPFLLDDRARKGLYPELIPLLALGLPQRQLSLSYVPRKRLDALMEHEQLDGAVLGVSPLWFSPKERQRNLWTPPLLSDADLLVSRRDAPLRYSGPASLFGRRVALPRGYLVPGLNEAMAAGQIAGEQPESETSALAMLMHGRVEAAVLTQRTLQALLLAQPGWQQQLHLQEAPLGRFELCILVPERLADLHAPLSDAVRWLTRSPAWAALLRRHLDEPALGALQARHVG